MINPNTDLKNDLGLISALSIVVGMVLGAGAFMKPSAVLATAGDTNTALWAWVIGGIISMAGGLTLCELGVMFPRTGGIFVYLEEIYNQKISFLYGWVLAFIAGPATIGALVGYFSMVFCLLFNIPDAYNPVVGAGILSFVLFVNSISVKRAGNLQTIATFCKLIPLVLIIVFGLFKGNGKIFLQSTGMMSMMGPFSAAVLATLFAYDGWSQVASVAGEIEKPGKILPQAIIGGLSFLIVVYLAINIAMFKILSAAQIVTLGHDAAAVISQKLFGLAGGNLVAVGIMISIVGGINGYIMTLSRVVYLMGERRQLPYARFFGQIDSDSKTPVYCSVFICVMAFIYYRIFDADKLTDIAVFAIWNFYALTFIAVIIARRKFPDTPRSYKVPFYPFIPVLAIAGSLYCIFGMIQANVLNAVFAIIFMLSGLPVYSYLTRSSGKIVIPKIKTCYVVAAVSLIVISGLYISIMVTDTRPVLRVAVSPTLKPYMFENKDGSKAGFEIDLLTKIAYDAGYKMQISSYEFETLFGAMDAKRADIAIAMMSITNARKQQVSFSESYYSGKVVLFAPKSIPIKGIKNLEKIRIGVMAQTTGHAFAKEVSGAKIQSFNNIQDMLNAYIANNIDSLIWDAPMIDSMKKENSQFDGEVKYVFDEEKYAIAMNRNETRMKEKIDAAIKQLEKSGELKKLKEKWKLL